AGEIGIAGEQNESADLRTGEDQLDRIDGETNVSGVLLGGSVRGRHDHVDRRFSERHHVLWVAPPVSVRALDGDFAFDDVGGEQVFELRLKLGANTHRDVVEVDEQCCVWRVVGGRALRLCGRHCLGPAVDRFYCV